MTSLLFIYIAINVVGIPLAIYNATPLYERDETAYVELPKMDKLVGDVDW